MHSRAVLTLVRPCKFTVGDGHRLVTTTRTAAATARKPITNARVVRTTGSAVRMSAPVPYYELSFGTRGQFLSSYLTAEGKLLSLGRSVPYP
jgi:hypothetical protein